MTAGHPPKRRPPLFRTGLNEKLNAEINMKTKPSAQPPSADTQSTGKSAKHETTVGTGGETHQLPADAEHRLTTDNVELP